MIGYYHHFGDYARDTQGLDLYEHAVYLNLIHWYYLNERPIPLDWRETKGVTRTKNKKEHSVTGEVLARFFSLKDGAWHHKRIDKEIARYRKSAPKRQARKDHEHTRQKRYRDWRASAFEALRGAGCIMPWNASAMDLKEMMARLKIEVPEAPESQYSPEKPQAPTQVPATGTNSRLGPVVYTCRATTLEPKTLTLNPVPSRVTGHADDGKAVAVATAREPSAAASACIELRKLGLTSVNPHDPRLQAALAEGVTLDDLRSAAVQALAVKATNPWAYLLATARGRIKQAQEGLKSPRGCTNGELVRAMVPGIASNAPGPDFLETLDVDARRLD